MASDIPAEIGFLTIAEASRLIERKKLSPVELISALVRRAEILDPQINAYLLPTAEKALAQARDAEREIMAGAYRGAMHGIPFGLKDIYSTAGIRTTGHSKTCIDTVPSCDATTVAKLYAAGAVLMGKFATHEFAHGGPSFDLPWPPARNPWNRDHFTGGSSSGSGAAVAAGLVRIAMGSDTGGSIRGPAFYCGTVGLKPTYGLVSRRGVFPLSYTLDHCGPLTWSVEDAALTMQVIAGYDALDPASADLAVPDFTSGIGQDLAGLKLAYPRSFFATQEDIAEEMLASLDASAQQLAKLGAKVEEIELPDFELFNACGRVILIAEAYAIHEKNLLTRPLDYARYTYQRMMVGATISAADLTQAFRLRRELAAIINTHILGTYDAIITANGLTPAPRFDEFPADVPPKMTLQTMPFNVTGNPALAIPTGFAKGGLPLGMQIVGRAFNEPTVLRIGAAFEAASGWINMRPAVEQ